MQEMTGTQVTNSALDDQQMLRPALIVGLGGTGRLVLTHLKALFIQLHGQVPPGVRLVAFDTARDAVSVSVSNSPVRLEENEEFHYIGQVPVAGIVKHFGLHDTIAKRLPQLPRLPRFQIVNGTGQVRPLGALALLWHAGTVVQVLDNALNALAAGQDLGALGGLAFRIDRGLQIFVVNSLAGGTGSGQFLDIAHILQALVQRLGNLGDFTDIIGIGVLPDAFRNVRGFNLQQNTAAALLELEHCMKQGDFDMNYAPGLAVRGALPPFKVYYLIGGVNQEGRVTLTLEGVCESVALGLYHMILTPIGQAQDSIFANIQGVLARTTPEGHGTYFASFGVAELVFPAEQIVQWCALRQAREMVKALLSRAPEGVDAEVDRFLQEHKLTKGELVPALALDETGTSIEEWIDAELREPPHQDYQTAARVAEDRVKTFERARMPAYEHRLETNQKQKERDLAEAVEQRLQQITNDPTRGPIYAAAFASGLARKLDALLEDLEEQAQVRQAESERSKLRVDNVAANLEAALSAKGLWGRVPWVRRAKSDTIKGYIEEARGYYKVRVRLAATRKAVTLVAHLSERLHTWADKMNALQRRLEALGRRWDHVIDQRYRRLVSPRGPNSAVIVDRLYLETLFQQHKVATEVALQALFGREEESPFQWPDRSDEELEEVLLKAAAEPFRPILEMDIEQVLQDRPGVKSPEQWANWLLEQASPSWDIDSTRMPQGYQSLEPLKLLGVPDARQSIFRASFPNQLVSTGDHRRLTAFTMVAGAPFSALRRWPEYFGTYEKSAERYQFHVLPNFVTDRKHADREATADHEPDRQEG